MARRTYGQFCGIAKALELVGERWALLIVRNLLIGPKRFTDLRQELRGIPTNVLTSRLKELETSGVIQRRVLPRPASAVVYELTSRGRELEDVLLRLGRWGAESLDEPPDGEPGYIDLSIRAFRLAFRPDAAAGLRATYEIRFGTFVSHARVDNGHLEVGQGPTEDPDVVIEVLSSLTPVMIGDVTPDEAVRSGRVRLTGDPKLFERFIEVFSISPGSPHPAGHNEGDA